MKTSVSLFERIPAEIVEITNEELIFALKNDANPSKLLMASCLIKTLGIPAEDISDFFHVGQRLRVKISRVEQNNIEAIPLCTPTDEFLRNYPIGSKVIGTVIHANDTGMMVIRLAENVETFVKNTKKYQEGSTLTVKLVKFDPLTKMIKAIRQRK